MRCERCAYWHENNGKPQAQAYCTMKARVLAGHLEACANFRPRFDGDPLSQLRECANGDGCVGCPLDGCHMLLALIREVLAEYGEKGGDGVRFIDGDALENAIDRERQFLIKRQMLGAEHIIVHHARRLVEEAPTIDAIPVEWLEGMAENSQNLVMQAAIDFLLTVWRNTNCGAEMDGEQTAPPP